MPLARQELDGGGTDSFRVGLGPVPNEPFNQFIGLHCTQQAKNIEGILAANPIGPAGLGVPEALFELDHLRGDQGGWTRNGNGLSSRVARFQRSELVR